MWRQVGGDSGLPLFFGDVGLGGVRGRESLAGIRTWRGESGPGAWLGVAKCERGWRIATGKVGQNRLSKVSQKGKRLSQNGVVFLSDFDDNRA